jgi:hypothetical protein
MGNVEANNSNNPNQSTADTCTPAKKEQEGLEQLKQQFPDSSPSDLLRFLRARGLNVKLAAEMYINYQNWYSKYRPYECDEKIFKEQLDRGKIYIITMNGEHPILYFLPREHDPDRDNYKQVVRFCCYIYELALKHLPNSGTVEFISFVNCNGIGFKNVDRKLIKNGITIYQDYFPERLHTCYVYGLPNSFSSLWSMIEKLLDERTRGKVVLLKKSQHKEVFNKYPKELLPVELGGTNETIEEYSKNILMVLHQKYQSDINNRSPSKSIRIEVDEDERSFDKEMEKAVEEVLEKEKQLSND